MQKKNFRKKFEYSFNLALKWKNVTLDEMKAFIGLIINMGINVSQKFSPVKDFYKYFGCFTFQKLLLLTPLFTHGPKSTKLSFLFLSNKFLSIFKPSKNIAIDESTVGYKRKISFKTYNPQKPRKWGLRTIFIYSFIPYYGKLTTDSLIRSDLSFTSRIVLFLFENIRIKYPDLKGMHIYTDRFYTNAPLAQELSLFKCHLTGTINPGRKGNCKEIKKPKTLAYRKNNILLLSWKDKRIVTICSSWHDSSVETIERHTKQGLEQIKKTIIVSDYTQNMGGVDIADQFHLFFSKKIFEVVEKIIFGVLKYPL
ncbi:hypothetical protein LAZ67_X002054 [Cordylochernes scorpioides]|uniref:PiggyBac transposable element-derived protein domain-containing protein n=1 Tax=Cordylochernes scorpioides TaxID=51811 RepID=A0ABY6LU66_9ARAC|nr:hypothetical protein LAZ67_X002054 [Cordylochernes scorpioides]